MRPAALLLVVVSACWQESTSTAEPSDGDQVDLCLAVCRSRLESCWPNPYHDEQVRLCLVEHTECRAACYAM